MGRGKKIFRGLWERGTWRRGRRVLEWGWKDEDFEETKAGRFLGFFNLKERGGNGAGGGVMNNRWGKGLIENMLNQHSLA